MASVTDMAAAQPVQQAGASPLTGFVPPPEHRWKPGQSGNPNPWAGQPPPGPHLRRALTKLLTEHPENADKIVRALVAQAISGDVKAASLIWDREEGKPGQKIEHSGSVTSVNINCVDGGESA